MSYTQSDWEKAHTAKHFRHQTRQNVESIRGRTMNPSDLRDHISQQCGFNKAKQGEVNAVQVCSAGEWPETDHGGNWTPDRREANIAFSEWLDQQGDSIVPSSFSEWLGSEDSIFIE